MKELMKVYFVDEVVEGTSDNGNDWQRQQVVFETTGESPKKLAVDFMGSKKVETTRALKPGDICEVVYTPMCREYEGKWYTKLDGVRCTLLQPAGLTESEQG